MRDIWFALKANKSEICSTCDCHQNSITKRCYRYTSFRYQMGEHFQKYILEWGYLSLMSINRLNENWYCLSGFRVVSQRMFSWPKVRAFKWPINEKTFVLWWMCKWREFNIGRIEFLESVNNQLWPRYEIQYLKNGESVIFTFQSK